MSRASVSGAESAGPIVVIGSINMDLVCRVPSIPRPGETRLGSDCLTIPGGKGANQAVAAAKLTHPARPVHLVGRVGDDDFGQRLLNGLRLHQVKTDHVTVTEGVSSGVAMVLVDELGENSTVVAPGANSKLSPRDIDTAKDLIQSASVVLMQLEIPLETVRHAINLCRELQVRTILDPAPAPVEKLPVEMYAVDVLTPNQSEAESLLSVQQAMGRMKRKQRVDAKQIGGELLSLGPKRVVLKLGSRGAMIVGDEFETVPGYKINIADTTAAGDAFTGALAVAWAEGATDKNAVRFANAAGALSCTAFGAQPSLPNRDAVDALLAKEH